MSLFATKVRTAFSLGLGNLASVASYRNGVRFGWNGVRRLTADLPSPPFFDEPKTSVAPSSLPSSAKHGGLASAISGGSRSIRLEGEPPDWHLNPTNGSRVKDPARPWWRIADFDAELGDIKTVWEASRFDWVLSFAQQSASGQPQAIERLNHWLGDWCKHNAPYQGPNWKCGQEASIRVMHLAMAALIIEPAKAARESLLDLIEAHLQRIAPTIQYAMAQDNNHGTSEAAALFIGGSWLARAGREHAGEWARTGRFWLENRAGRLIEKDGSFSQYSLNYHRVMLDTLSMAEVWRRRMGLPSFSTRFYERAGSAMDWLYAMVDPATGDGPNLGANDGARLLPLAGTGYRDYRPAVQLAAALFSEKRAYTNISSCDETLAWLGLPLPNGAMPPPKSTLFRNGGYAVLRGEGTMALLRFPRFRFRPSHADALHVDFWLDGQNHLRDGGTYSYNTDPEWLEYFPGTASHNTVQFDGRDQMPRLSRFLFGDWLKTSALQEISGTPGKQQCGASYQDAMGVRHARNMALHPDRLIVHDEVAGPFRKVTLRWRLQPGAWRVQGESLTDGVRVLSVKASVPLRRFSLVTGWESRHYLQKTEIPVLEVDIDTPGFLTTEYIFRP